LEAEAARGPPIIVYRLDLLAITTVDSFFPCLSISGAFDCAARLRGRM
jgi:hypothetical protein